MSESTKYYAKGKLLITGEYAVLDGAKALAVPCKFGQWMEVTPTSNPKTFIWKSMDVNGKIWFDISFDTHLNIISTSDTELAKKLQHILKTAQDLNPSFTLKVIDVKVTTTLEFDRSWGLGSSSTLVHLISQWAEVNPYELLKKTFGGSGYDIACADANTPLLYQIVNNQPEISKVKFTPPFTDKIWFIHLGEKQVSSNEISKYSRLKFDRQEFANQISQLTDALINTGNLQEFTLVLNQHEQLVSSVLGIPTIKEERFPNVSGCFKSLGAWGGDFVLFVGEKAEVEKIQKLGYSTILPWNKMLITPAH